MKRILSVLLCVILVFSAFSFTACVDRSETLKVYNVGEYMDEGVIDGFAEWYDSLR